MWLFVFLVLRGVKDAAVINYIVTIAKVVPILVFIVIAIIAFKADVFTDNFWGGEEVFVFVDLGPGHRHDVDHGIRVLGHRGR